MKNAGIKLNPHKARHWFVTSMLRGIYETSDTAGQIEDKKKQLIEYMKWRDPETLAIYEHYYDEQKFRELHEKLQENYLKREKEFKDKSKNKQLLNEGVNLFADLKSGNEDHTESWLSEFYEGMDS